MDTTLRAYHGEKKKEEKRLIEFLVYVRAQSPPCYTEAGEAS